MSWNRAEHWYSPKRIAVAVLIAAAIYAAALAMGTALYAADVIPTGATHNDCPNYREEIARERDISETDVPGDEVRDRTIECLAEHELEEDEVLRTEFITWGAWPGVVSALVFLFWPVWSRVLLNQEAHEELEEGGGGHRPDEHT